MRRFNDAVVQTRVDKRHLATAVEYFTSVGRHPRTVSELAREIVEGFSNILTSNGRVEFVSETEAAEAVLQDVFGYGSVNPGGRGKINEFSNMNLDAVEQVPKMVERDRSIAKMTQRALGIHKKIENESMAEYEERQRKKDEAHEVSLDEMLKVARSRTVVEEGE